MKKDSELLSCWPDGYSRYYIISRALHDIFGKQKINILDLGGDSKWMYEFLNEQGVNFSLHIVDQRKPDFKNPNVKYTKGDFFKLKASEYLSDVTVNTDVLEHVPKDMKIPFVEKCLELTKKVAVFSGPFEAPDVTLAEKSIDNLSVKVSGKQQRWLKEHFEFGKPKAKDIEAVLQKQSLPYVCLYSNNINNWLLTFTANLVHQQVSNLEDMDGLNRFYNEHILSIGDSAGTPYRRVYVVFKDKSLAKKVDALQKELSGDESTKTLFYSKVMEAFAGKVISLGKEAAQATKKSAENERKLAEAKVQLAEQNNVIEDLSSRLDYIQSKLPYKVARKLKHTVKKVSRK